MRGLALEGGGAKGSFHIGAVKALYEMGIAFDGVSGTSVGALNAAMIAAGDFDACCDLWDTLDTLNVFDFDDEIIHALTKAQITSKTVGYLTAKARKIFGEKGIDTTKLKGIIDAYIDEEKIRASKMDFALVTVSLSDLRPMELHKEDIPKGEIGKYVMASASFPGFRTNPIGDKMFIDGGIYDNLPINTFIDCGYDEIFAVRTMCIGRVRKPKNAKNVKITYIVPPEDLGSILIFDRAVIKKNIQMGYYEAKRAVLGYKGTLYYVDNLDEEAVFRGLCNLPSALTHKLARHLNFRKKEGRRLLFEDILPLIATAFHMSAEASYGDIMLAAMEYVANDLGMERFRLYTFREFARKIYKGCRGATISPLPAIVGTLFKENEIKALCPSILGAFCGSIIHESDDL